MRPACRAGARKSSGIRAARDGGAASFRETGFGVVPGGPGEGRGLFLVCHGTSESLPCCFHSRSHKKAHASGAHLVSHCFLNRPVETFALVLRVGHCVNRLATREYGVSQREGATEDSREGDGFSPPRRGYTKAFSSRCFLVSQRHISGARE